MAGELIMVVDDEVDILELIKFNLEKEGYRTICVTSGEEALKKAYREKPNLIILDLMLPGVDGLDVCRQLKSDKITQEVPVLMVTAKSEDSDVVLGLEMGADDYLVKPFSPKILIARIRSIFRRKRREQVFESVKGEPLISIHDIVLDTAKHEVRCAGKSVTLSVTEFAILELLARNPGWVFSRNQIIMAVKGEDYPVTERSVDVQILGLRRKIGTQGKYIETIRGIGYRMQE